MESKKKKSHTHRTESRKLVARGWGAGGEKRGRWVKGYKLSAAG